MQDKKLTESTSKQPSLLQPQDQNFSFAITIDSTHKKGSLGPFEFDLQKFQPLLKDPVIKELINKQNWPQDLNEDTVLQILPREAYQALNQYTGKSFKPSTANQNVTFHQVQPIVYVPITISISHIKFTNLTKLNLAKQNITSVEPLAFLDAPKLACLELYQNQIYTMEPLIKAKFTQLRILTFYGNPIAKMNQFYRIHNKKLSQYEFDNGKDSEILMQDYRFLFKMENTNFKTLNVKDPSRINLKERKIFKKLDQPGTDIVFYVKPNHLVRRRMMMRD